MRNPGCLQWRSIPQLRLINYGRASTGFSMRGLRRTVIEKATDECLSYRKVEPVFAFLIEADCFLCFPSSPFITSSSNMKCYMTTSKQAQTGLSYKARLNTWFHAWKLVLHAVQHHRCLDHAFWVETDALPVEHWYWNLQRASTASQDTYGRNWSAWSLLCAERMPSVSPVRKSQPKVSSRLVRITWFQTLIKHSLLEEC